MEDVLEHIQEDLEDYDFFLSESGIVRLMKEAKLSDIPEDECNASTSEEPAPIMDSVINVQYVDPVLTLHPLLIPEIVNHVLHKLDSPTDLHKCRKICSMWNQEAVKIIQQKAVVTLRALQAIVAYTGIMETTQDYPHQNFIINGVLEFQSPEVIRFFELFGPTMKSVHIDVWGNRTFAFSVFKRLAVAPNLESLSVKFYKFCNITSNMDLIRLALECGDCIGNPIGDLEDTPLRLPKLKHLILDIDDSFGNPADIEAFINDVIISSNLTLEKISFDSFTADVYLGRFVINILANLDIPLPNLREVNFLLRLSDNETFMLAKKEVALRELKQLASSNLRASTLSSFLQTMNSTLKKYFLTMSPNGNIARMEIFPCKMNALAHLHLNGYQGCLSNLRCTPNLKSLTLENVDLSGMLPYGGYFLDRPPCDSLKIFKVLSATTDINASVILRISDLFPNVTVLSIVNVTDDALDMMYKCMPYLAELSISGDSITDEAICGIPNKNCQEIMNTITFFVVDDFVVRKYLFIGNLCKLKILTIQSDSITDLSVMFGIARTLKLEKLCIKAKGVTDISLGAFERMHLTHLDISDCPNFSPISQKKLSQTYVGLCLVMKRLTYVTTPTPEVNSNKAKPPANVLQFDYKDMVPVAQLPLIQQRIMFFHQLSSAHRCTPEEERDRALTLQGSTSSKVLMTNERALRQMACVNFWEQIQQMKDMSIEMGLLEQNTWFNCY